jgi:hypothetical protein
MPKNGEVVFPIDLNLEPETKKIPKSSVLSEAVGFGVFLWFFWNLVLVAGLFAGKPMTNSLTGIDSFVGTPARLLLWLLAQR